MVAHDHVITTPPASIGLVYIQMTSAATLSLMFRHAPAFLFEEGGKCAKGMVVFEKGLR